MLGLHFLEESKLKGKQRKGTTSEDSSNPENSASQRYRDYLTEYRKEGKQDGKKAYFNEIHEVKRIMRMKDHSDQEKFELVRMMAEKIESHSMAINSDGLIKKITAKLEIVESLY